MNSVNIIGRLGGDPELKYTQSGMAICTVSVAFEQGKDKDAGWVHVVAMEKTAENLAQYMNKGDEIGVSGRLSHRSWESNEGQKRSALEVVANRIDFLRKKGEGGGGGGGNADEARAQAYDRKAEPAETAPLGDNEDPFG